MEYHLIAPIHGKKVNFEFALYQWSDSWMDVIIEPIDMVPERTFFEAIPITNQPYCLQEINQRKDAVVVLNMRSNETMRVMLNVHSRLGPEVEAEILNLTQNYLIKRYHNQTIIIALPGIIHFISFRSPITQHITVVNIIYKWLYNNTGPAKIQDCGCEIKAKATGRGRGRGRRLRPRFHRIIPTSRGEYHFHKFCFCSCYATGCRYLYSWNQTAAFCKGKGLSLPTILSRSEQEELISILKTSCYSYFIEALFISMLVSHQLRSVHGSIFF